MKLSEKMLVVAEWLSSSDNDLIVEAEKDEACLEVVADALAMAAEMLKTSAAQVEEIEPEEPMFSAEKLEEMAALAEAFDDSGDELLQKQAALLDEILLTIAAPKNAKLAAAKWEDEKIDQIKKKYKEVKERHDEINKVSDAVKEIEKSPKMKEYRILEQPLSTRVCPEHFCQMSRIGENQYQCALDHKVYNWETGFTTLTGNKIPGGSVSNQTQGLANPQNFGSTVFDSRNSKLGLDK